VNFSYFDKYFFEGMFGDFYFPDGTQPDWESLKYVQMEFMKWFNAERLKTVLTFPVESVTLLFKDGKYQDMEMFDFVCQEYARGHSFFTYISDTVDSLSSCCRLKNKLQTKEFNFTNGNIGVQTGSKSVITFNLSRIIQNWYRRETEKRGKFTFTTEDYPSLKNYMVKITDRVYKYHTAYNELLWDMYDADLLPVYKAGFIDLNKQYLTLGLNGLNQAAEFLGLTCSVNDEYAKFCQEIFGFFSEQNRLHEDKTGPHKLIFNTEQVPAESLAAKNYNWDKEDGYWVPEDTNLYASYVFKPNDPNTTVLDKIRMHGREYIGDFLDGGSAAHINLDSHLTAEQYKQILIYTAQVGCSYITFNIPMTECLECGHIVNAPVDECPHCGSKKLKFYTRIIGYLTAVANWANPRKKEFEDRIFAHIDKDCCDNINSGGYIGFNKYKAK
jgi:ribonucleoside-triphosphate reductase